MKGGLDLISRASPKVSNFNGIPFNEEVLRLHVPVKEAVLVHVGESKYGLVHDGLDLGFVEALLLVLHQLVDILLHVFKHEVEVVVDPDHLLELDDLLVVEFAEGLDLAEGHALLPRVELLLHLLDGYLLLGRYVDSFDDRAVSAITQRLRDLILIHI